MTKKKQNSDNAEEQKGLPYEKCLNCGTELNGRYCHNCGQEAVDKTPTIGSFIFEYVDHAFKWDHNFFSTFWTLISRPGHLTNEYNSGKFISQEHPLKLNMFLLLVFATMFLFFSSADKITNSVYELTNDEQVLASVQVQMLAKNSEYALKMQESPQDTVLLEAPLFLAKEHPQIISCIEIKEDPADDSIEKWVAALPRVLIEDKHVVIDGSGYYRINTETATGNNGVKLFNTIWAEMVGIASHYFPILLLLTVPFLAIALIFVQRKSKIPGVSHFVFALHYTAFLESLMIFIYTVYLTIAPPMQLLQYIMVIGSCLYLTLAHHKVYAGSWLKAIAKSLLINLIYFSILLLIFMVIFIVACFITVANTF